MMNKVSNNSQHIDGMEVVLGGFRSSKEMCNADLTLTLHRPGFPVSYVNTSIRLDPVTGLLVLSKLELSDKTVFSANGFGTKKVDTSKQQVKDLSKVTPAKLSFNTDLEVDPV